MGFLPEAIVNYVALLGWHPADEKEFFTLQGLVESFDIDRINKSSAAFSFPKLEWLNGEHIRALSPEEFHRRALPWYPSEVAERFDTAKISRLIQPRVVRLTDIPGLVAFFVEPVPHDTGLYANEKSKATLASMRGRTYPFHGAKLIVTYHTAAVLRNPELKRPGWEDMQLLAREYLKD